MECIYPTPLSAATPARFIVTVLLGHYLISRPDQPEKTRFLHLTPDELINCEDKFRRVDVPGELLPDESCQNGQASVDAPIPRALAPLEFILASESSRSREIRLIQYC